MIVKKQKSLIITLGILVFLGGLSASYFALGNKLPWGAKVWLKIARQVPVPVASVGGLGVKYSALAAAESIDIKKRFDFVIKQASILALARKAGLDVSDDDVADMRETMITSWNMDNTSFLNLIAEKKITDDVFDEVFVKPEVARDLLGLKINKLEGDVTEVENKLRQVEDFAALARVYSDDLVTAPLGGDAGFVAEYEIYAGVWDRSRELKKGDWAGPINTPDGYMFVQRLEQQRSQGDSPEKLHLRIILIESVDFDTWLDDQIEALKVRIYI